MHTAKIIALSLGLGIVFFIVMALVSRLFVHRPSKSNKEDIYTIDGHHGDPQQLPRRASSWRQLFVPKQKDQHAKWVPTVSGIVKAGDEGVLSAMFTNPQGHPGEVSFEAICELFANELRPRSMTERSTYPGEVVKFVNSAKRGASGPKRTQSISYNRASIARGDIAPATQRRSLDISAIERGLGRSLSIKRPAPLLVPLGNGLLEADTTSDTQRAWTKDGRPAEYHDGRLSVRITPVELAVLSVLLGTTIISAGAADIDKGAFGAVIQSTSTYDGRHVISLRRYKRDISQLPPSGSGHSALFAKHLACGSLPFAQDGRSISSMILTDDSLEAVRSGIPVTMRRRSQQSSSTKFLAQLPHAHDLTIHALETSTKSSPANPLIDAITMLPFVGGLAPLASRPLIETVRFVASAGLHHGRLLQRLEGLVDKVQRHSSQVDVFGPLYEPHNAGLLFRQRERLGKVATGGVTEELVDKVARMRRFVTLLQRLMALVPDMKPRETLAAVQEATKTEFARSYADAVVAHRSASASASVSFSLRSNVNGTHCPQSDARSNRRNASTASRSFARRSPQSSLGSATNSARLSMTFPEYNLGRQVEQLLKSELPFSVEMIATVARLVIVAWTFSVGTVAWEASEEGFRVPDIEKLPENMLFV